MVIPAIIDNYRSMIAERWPQVKIIANGNQLLVYAPDGTEGYLYCYVDHFATVFCNTHQQLLYGLYSYADPDCFEQLDQLFETILTRSQEKPIG